MEEFEVQYTSEAEEDLVRLFEFYLDKNEFELADRALEAIETSISQLKIFPYNCRKVLANNSYLRETIIPFATTGYVAIYEIDPIQNTVTILAVRHQREEDYH